MPSFVRPQQCDGCHDREQVACVYICPHDLMALDPDGAITGHPLSAFNREPEQCWECYACVKACPSQAVGVRAYADIVPLGGAVEPRHAGGTIEWQISFRNGNSKQFSFPVRTTEAGSIDPYAGKPVADMALIDKPGFFDQGQQNGFREGDPSELIRK